MLELLDDESRFPEATDQSLLTKWSQQFNGPFFRLSPNRNVPRAAPQSVGASAGHNSRTSLSFFIQHYAGQVRTFQIFSCYARPLMVLDISHILA